MNVTDLVNGAFEFIGGLFLTWNVCKLYQAKEVKGVSVASTAFFTSWGIWNLAFYPANGMWASFTGGLLIVTANTAWVGLAIYYSTRFEPGPLYNFKIVVNGRQVPWFSRTITFEDLAGLEFPELDATTLRISCLRDQRGAGERLSWSMRPGDVTHVYPNRVFHVTASTPVPDCGG